MAKNVANESWEVLYTAQLSNYETIVGIDHNWDAKFGIVVAGILATSVFVLTPELYSTNNKLLFSLVIIGCVFFALSLLCALFSLYPKNYPLPANTTKERSDYVTMPHEKLMYQLISDVEQSIEVISERVKNKALAFSVSGILFILGTLILLTSKLLIH